MLRAFDIPMPPALAVGLIPLVMDAPSLKYPLSVAAGTAGLTGLFIAWRVFGSEAWERRNGGAVR